MKNVMKNILFGLMIVSCGSGYGMQSDGANNSCEIAGNEGYESSHAAVSLSSIANSSRAASPIIGSDEANDISLVLAKFAAKENLSARTRAFGSYAKTLLKMLQGDEIASPDLEKILAAYQSVYSNVCNVNSKSSCAIKKLIAALLVKMSCDEDADQSDATASTEIDEPVDSHVVAPVDIHIVVPAENQDIVLDDESDDVPIEEVDRAFEFLTERIVGTSEEQKQELEKLANVLLEGASAGFVSSDEMAARCYAQLLDALSETVPAYEIPALMEYAIILSPFALAALIILSCDYNKGIVVVAAAVGSCALKCATLAAKSLSTLGKHAGKCC